MRGGQEESFRKQGEVFAAALSSNFAETIAAVQRSQILLSKHCNLAEMYKGLYPRGLVFVLMHVRGAFKLCTSGKSGASVHCMCLSRAAAHMSMT